MQHKFALILLVTFLVPFCFPLLAQNPDLQLSPEERQERLNNYKNIFPIWGRKVIEKGFDLPKPFGVNVNYVWMNQPIEIPGMSLGVNDSPLAPIQAIQFDDAESNANTVNARFDLWVLPFINVYTMVGRGWADTDVRIKEPIEFSTGVNQSADYVGFGTSASIGIKKNFAVFDINWARSYLELLDEPVDGRTMGVRYGRNFRLGGTKRLAVWVGAMNVHVGSITNGQVALADVLPSDVRDQLASREYQNETWYKLLPPDRKENIDNLADGIIDFYDTGSISYSLEKKPAAPWNMVVGGNFELNRSWHFRFEVGLIERWSVLLNACYRLDL
jgi:hypothetical protein